MASSYIIQGTNIVCTNMQVPSPLKLGIPLEELENIPHCSSNVVTTNKNSYYLTEGDKKINKTFKCKMAAKKWGGLAMLCAGLAIGGAILLCVATGGLAAPALVALATTVTTAGVAVAVVGTVVSVGIRFYKEAHDCDATLESPWSNVYETVKFQKKKALLNHSYMTCAVGGQLSLIVDDVIAQQFIYNLSANLQKNDMLLLGVDLIKSEDIVLPAYNDSKGITAQFNLNILERINNELEANFNLDNFEHLPKYDAVKGIAESYILSTKAQTVSIKAMNATFDFDEGEKIHTEISRKYNDELINKIIENSDFKMKSKIMDSKKYFADYILSKN